MEARCIHYVVALLLAALTVPSVHAAVVFTDSFDSLSLAGFRAIGNNNAQLVNAPIRAGAYSAQLSLNRATDSASGRTELLVQDPMFDIGGEYWIGFSNFFPSTTQFDDSVDIVFNLHARPDAGEDPEGAPVSLRVQSGQWRLVSRSDPAAISTPGSNLSRGFAFGAVETNRWNDWVFHVRLSPGADGLLEVWKDGTQVVNFQGPTTYNDQRGPFMKMGIYKPLWKNGGASASSERTINIDEVKIGDSGSAYAEVAPDPSVVPTTIPGMVVAPVALPDVDDAPVRGSVTGPVDMTQPGSVPEFAPGATETDCTDFIDDDNDSLIDLADPDCSVSGTGPTETICDDSIDDDGDGLIDLADPDCSGSGTGLTETICDDLIDDDGDGLVDLDDADCSVSGTGTVETDCTDSIDDDGDGLIDLDDADCSVSGTGTTEINCTDSIDDDGDGLIDLGDTADCSLLGPETTETVCTDLIDNDGDTLIDLADTDCSESGTGLTETICDDLADDDGDGLIDLDDSDCLTSGTSEVCGDFIDNDGDTLVDEDC